MMLSGDETKFLYEFNKDGDYIHNTDNQSRDGEGHKYTVQELKKYAEMFIDKIIECEEDLVNHMD